MRILMPCYEYPPLGGGASRVVEGLAGELVATRNEVDCLTMGFRGLARTERTNRKRVYRLPCIRLRTSPCTMPEAATYLATAVPRALSLARKRAYHLTHAHFILPDGLIAFILNKLTGLPYVITAHGSDVPGYNPHALKLAHRILRPLWNMVVRNAARIVCPSHTLQALLTRHQPHAASVVIPNGFDPGRLTPPATKKPRILVATRMVKRKGVQYFLQALKGSAFSHEVHIVGDGPYLGALRALAAKLNLSVTFWGWLDNDSPQLKELYESSAIYVFPSESENFPVVLLEAMAAGSAIITTKGTGCEEVVGESAALVAMRSPDALREALTLLLNDDERRAQMGAAARKRLEEHFSWPSVAERYLALYEECRRQDGGRREGRRDTSASRSPTEVVRV